MIAKKFPIYYGWVNVVLGAIAMTETLPGRTHGLGLITKPLLEELKISETDFASINFVTTLIGAAFAIPMGIAIDRLGVRLVSTVTLAGLTAAVFWMSVVNESFSLFWSLLLIRGLGQTSLSIAAMAIISKWFRARTGPAMGLFAVLLTFGFIASILGIGAIADSSGWRVAWQVLGYSLLGSVPLMWLLVGDSPERCGVTPDREREATSEEAGNRDYTVFEALRTPAFWIVVSGTSLFNFVWSAITLFNESVLGAAGFEQNQAVEMMAFLTGLGLLANLAGGAISTRRTTSYLLGVSLILLAISLALFPFVQTITQLRIYGCGMGVVGGIITVVHFAVWSQYFGRAEIGRIQGAAQIMTVLASAAGPYVLAQLHSATGAHTTTFYLFSALCIPLAIAAFVMKVPPRLSAARPK